VHEGILGIVAGKIKEEAKRPTVIVAPNGDEYKGTGRSVNKVDIYEMLNRYGTASCGSAGHKAGLCFTVEPDRIEPLPSESESGFGRDPEKDACIF
jgi:single-stranded-DNA-specific exonuclease